MFSSRSACKAPLSSWRRSISSFNVVNPYTGKTYREFPYAQSKEVKAQVAKAAVAQKEWAAGTSIQDRIRVCEAFIARMDSKKQYIAEDISNSMGKPLAQAVNEVNGVFERARQMMSYAPEVLAEKQLPPKEGFFRSIRKEPVGVVLAITPWNYPLLTTVNTVVPAVLAGNSVLIKPSPYTPLCGAHFADAFAAAGAPAGLVTSLMAAHDVVAEVIADERIGFVVFTGSVRGGHEVYRTVAATRFIDTTLELGGKDAAYVCEDADAAAAAAALVDGACYNAGQSCCGIERTFVHHSKYREFCEAAAAEMNKLRVGNPMDAATYLGPMTLPSAPGFLASQVSEAKAGGARVLAGGSIHSEGGASGRFFQPTLVADCKSAMSVMAEESFGPILAVASVNNDDDAVAAINDSKYGLTAAVYTKDTVRARALALRLEVGTVFQNRCDYLDPMLPWGGRKDTGKGVSLSEHGFSGVTKLKGLHFRLG